MPRKKTPLGKLTDVAMDALKNPVGTAGKAVGQAVGQAKGTAALGKLVADQVSRTAVSKATELASSRSKGKTPSAPRASAAADLRPLPDPDAPAARDRSSEPTSSIAEKTAPDAEAPSTAVPVGGQPGSNAAPDAQAPAPATKAAAKKAPAKKTPAKKAAAKKAPAKKAPAKKAPAKKAPAKKTLGDEDIPTPADVAKKVAKKAPAQKAAATKAAPAPEPAPAERGLAEPAPLIDPGTAHAVQSESEMLRKAADPDKG